LKTKKAGKPLFSGISGVMFYYRRGDWLPLVKRLSESLGPLPEELFPEATQIALQSNTRRLWVNSERALLLTAPDPLDEIALRDEVRAIVDRTTLAPRETELLRMQFEQEKSLDEMGQVLDVTRERVRQIGGRALERLRKSADDLGASTAICSFKAFESHVRTDPVIRSALNDEVPHSSALCVEALWNWYCSFQNDLVLAAEGRCMTPQEFGAVGPAHAKQVDAAMVEQIRLFAKRYRKKYPGLPA
jgi:RNA polymerase sigma factor (sigma-70 family)